MLDFIQITNDAGIASRCDAIDGMRVFVDLERLGKVERQAGRNTFISQHTLEDVGRIKSVLSCSKLMVRVNPLNESTCAEVDDVVAQGADILMLPMFSDEVALREFSRIVDGRLPIVPLLETPGAFYSLDKWISTPGLWEVFVGLNDLHLSMGHRFIFEPLALGYVDAVAKAVKAHKLRFGFGGIARLDEGVLDGRAVLGEHLRLGSSAVILSRTFCRSDILDVFEDEVAALRRAEYKFANRSEAQIEHDRNITFKWIQSIAADLGTT